MSPSPIPMPDGFPGDYPSFRRRVGIWKLNPDALGGEHKTESPLAGASRPSSGVRGSTLSEGEGADKRAALIHVLPHDAQTLSLEGFIQREGRHGVSETDQRRVIDKLVSANVITVA